MDPVPYDNVHDPFTVTETPTSWDLSVYPHSPNQHMTKREIYM